MARRIVCALLPSLAIGCTLVEDLDGYTGGAVDSGTVDVSVPAIDSSTADTAKPDTAVFDTFVDDTARPDTAPPDTGTADTGRVDTGPPPYRHPIAIDGTNDFATADRIGTTTTGFDAWVSWDEAALYVGYAGSDLGAAAGPTKWVIFYVDVDPGSANGATKTETYGTQQHVLPSGFAADVYFALKTDESFQQLKRWSGSAWTTTTGGVTWKRTASAGYLEVKIPFAALTTTPSKLGLVSFMLNEDPSGPWTWAGLWSGSFVDGNSPASAPKTIGNWLSIDLSSSAAPSTGKRP